jgi:hypothetical protein
MALQTPPDFFKEIEEYVVNNNLTYIEAVILWCEKKNYEIENIGILIKKSIALKAKIEEEAEDLNFLKKISRLPI